MRVRIGINGVVKDRVRACVNLVRGVVRTMKGVRGELRCVGDGDEGERFVGKKWSLQGDDDIGGGEAKAMVAREVVRGCGERLFLGNARGVVVQIDVDLPIVEEEDEDAREMCVKGVIDAVRCFALAMHDEVWR